MARRAGLFLLFPIWLLAVLLPIGGYADWGPVDLFSGELRLEVTDHVVEAPEPIPIRRFHRSGMTFTIEPMINAGVAEGKIDHSDQWTARTLDAKPSAQWEHTLLVTPDGCEILTLPPK